MGKPKDRWDKFDIVSKFAVSVLIAAIAGLYTCSQNNLEKERQAKSLEVDTLSKFMPDLRGKDQIAKKAALLAIREIASTKFMAQLTQLYPSEGAVGALQVILESPDATQKDRDLATAALKATRILGRAYSFGIPDSGADDVDIAPSENLSLVRPDDLRDPEVALYFLREQAPNTTGLMRRLDPTKPYLACRYDSSAEKYLRSHLGTITNARDRTKTAQGRVVEWGPPYRAEYEDYVAALSPGLSRILGVKKGEEVEISFDTRGH